MSQLEQQMRHRDKEMVPRILVQAMFGLMIASLSIVAYAQWADVPNRGVLVAAPIAQSRDVLLVSDRNGAYRVTDTSGQVLALSSDARKGFIGVMGRTVDRQRRMHGVAGPVPLQVVRRENGNIAIIDETTAMSIELIGYGADNVAAFAQLLD